MHDPVTERQNQAVGRRRYNIEAKVAVFIDTPYLAHPEKVKTPYAVHALLTYPIKEAELLQALESFGRA